MVKQNTKKQCLKCQKDKVPTKDFYLSNSSNHSDRRYPICKVCIKENLRLEDPLSDQGIESFKTVLLEMNRPFLHSLYVASVEESKKTNKELFGMYLKNCSLNFKDYTWKDSEFDGRMSVEDGEDEEVTHVSRKSKITITDNIIDKWGDGYTPEEYQNFEKKYDRLIKNYGEKTALHTEGLLSYIRFRVKEEMATARGMVKDAKEWGALASKAATDGKINVSQLSKSDISGGVDVLSQLFEAVETEVGIIPLLPKVLAQPYDDADLIIWAIINYYRRLEDKQKVAYEDIYHFYDEMLEEHFLAKGYNEQEVEQFKAKRNNIFRDLEKVYVEPLYDTGDE